MLPIIGGMRLLIRSPVLPFLLRVKFSGMLRAAPQLSNGWAYLGEKAVHPEEHGSTYIPVCWERHLTNYGIESWRVCLTLAEEESREGRGGSTNRAVFFLYCSFVVTTSVRWKCHPTNMAFKISTAISQGVETIGLRLGLVFGVKYNTTVL